MQDLTDPHSWGHWIRIVVLDICLAGGNALGIALAVHGLGPPQQFRGRVWGTAGAVGLYVPGEMMLNDEYLHGCLGPAVVALLHRFLPLSTGLALAALGWLLARRSDLPESAPEET